MSTIERPDDVAAALTTAAAQRGVTEAELIADLVADDDHDELDTFVGIGASGHAEPFNVHSERARQSAPHDATTI